MEKGHYKLKIYQKAHELGVKVHKMSLSLPAFERYEEGSQIRRSSKSVSSNIVEGHAMRKYKKEYLLFLYRAYASSEETMEHLKYLKETGSLKDEKTYDELKNGYSELNKMLFSFIVAIEQDYKTPYFVTGVNNKSETNTNSNGG